MKRLISRGQRLLAVLICVGLILTEFPYAFFLAFASGGTVDCSCELDGGSLYEALCAAVSEGSTVTEEPLFAGQYAADYCELFEADGNLYELEDPALKKVNKRDKGIFLKVFARIEGDISLDEQYMPDGSEQVIFLIINNSGKKVNAVISVDGRETDVITVYPASVAKASRSDDLPSYATPSAATSSDAAQHKTPSLIEGYVYDSVRMAHGSAAAFVTTVQELLPDTSYVEAEDISQAYDLIYSYMRAALELAAGFEKEDYQAAEELWNELMNAWEIIYQALEDETIILGYDECLTLNRLTDDIYQCILEAGYNPYAIEVLSEYRLEVMGTFTLNGTGWRQSGGDGGEVYITTRGNTTTITGWSPGTVTLTNGRTTHTVIISDTVRACVYVSTADVSAKMLELLGIDRSTIDSSGYFPAGIVYINADYLTEEKKLALINASDIHNVPLITSEADWQLLLEDLTNMDTSSGVFNPLYAANAGNKVPDYIEDAASYIGNAADSGKTALFCQDGGEGYSSSFSDSLFHFDLLFHTNTVEYVYGNNGIKEGAAADGNTAIAKETYIQGVTIQEVNPEFTIPDGYVFEGYYLDSGCSMHWDGSSKLTEDMTVYIGLSEGVDVTVEKEDAFTDEFLGGAQFILYKVVSGVTYYYDFNEYTGWITDPYQATPYTTKASGEFIMTLADGDYFLKEVAAPDGYFIWEDVIEFRVTHTGSDGTNLPTREVTVLSPEVSDMISVSEDAYGYNTVIIVKNTPDIPGRELPETGGPGTEPFRESGLLLSVCALYLLFTFRRGRRCKKN